MKDQALTYAVIAAFIFISSGQGVAISPGAAASITDFSIEAQLENSPGAFGFQLPRPGDYLTLHMLYKTENDSVLYNSRTTGNSLRIPLSMPAFKAGIEEGLAVLSPGDFTTLKVSADSVFEKTFHAPLPAYIRKGSMLTFEIELLDIQPGKDVEKQLAREDSIQLQEETKKIQAYLKSKKMVVPAVVAGIYFLSKKEGNGNNAVFGKTVSVKYTARLLDGTVLESPAEKEAVQFKMGKGEMIKGFEKGIGMMKAGGTSMFIVPSKMGFVSMPYTPVVFEVELISVQ